MSFRIQKSHKFADQHPSGKESTNSTSDLLTSEDYLLFNLGDKPSGGAKSGGQVAKTRKGGQYIRPVNSAQADYY